MIESLFYLAGYLYGTFIKAMWYVGFALGYTGFMAVKLWPIPLALILSIYFIRKAHKRGV